MKTKNLIIGTLGIVAGMCLFYISALFLLVLFGGTQQPLQIETTFLGLIGGVAGWFESLQYMK